MLCSFRAPLEHDEALADGLEASGAARLVGTRERRETFLYRYTHVDTASYGESYGFHC